MSARRLTAAAAVVAFGAAAVLASPAAAAGPTGTATISPTSTVKRAAHVEFTLTPGLDQVVGALEGTIAIGTFRREVEGSCTATLDVTAAITASPPVKRGQRLVAAKKRPAPHYTEPDLRLRRAEDFETGRIYVGEPTGRGFSRETTPVSAAAVLPAPKLVATKRARWLVVRATPLLSGCTPAQAQAVDTTLRDDVWTVVRTVKVVKGAAGAARGVGRVPA